MQTESTANRWSAYFSAMSVLLLVLGIVAFSDNLFTDVGQPSNKDPKFIIHGLFGLAWYVLLAIQANLVRIRSMRLHRRLGTATFITAIGVTLTTLYLFVVLWKGWSNMTPEVRANRMLLPGFAACMLLAWKFRSRPAWHKRLVLIGTFFMLEPVLARTYDPLVASWAKALYSALYTEQVDKIGFITFLLGTWTGAFLSLAVYDLKTRSGVHVITAACLCWLSFALLVSQYS